jgi:hypothetical protein
MKELALLLGLLLLVVYYFGFLHGRRFGARKVARHIVDGFLVAENFDKKSGDINEAISKATNSKFAFGSQTSLATASAQLQAEGIGQKLADAGIQRGMEIAEKLNSIPSDEVRIVMSKTDLATIAWLADCGFYAQIRKMDDPYPLKKEQAERYSHLIDSFERKFADFFSETEDEKEQRFTLSHNRSMEIFGRYEYHAEQKG